jgi:periplasmic divalent cation tolerance protein
MTDAITVMTTTSSREEADKLAFQVVERKLAACAQIVGPISSVFSWQGAVTRQDEWLCMFKSTQHFYPQLEAAIREIHTYAVPEILALPVVAGNADYLNWLHTSLAAKVTG